MTLTIGTKLGRYEIRSQLGVGGMGEVYLADDTLLDRKVAIKVLPESSMADEQARKRLLQEARAAAKLDYPHICSIYEVGEVDGRSFIAMQYVEGETLDSRGKRQPFDWAQTLSIAAQVADALSEAHAQSIIHRDIKPSNIIITSRGQAKVMDFGLAKSIPQAVDSEARTESYLTDPGTVMGTLPYMSPEQVRGEATDGRSDLFSFGTMLYEMVSGRQPFASGSAAATASAILTHEPLPLVRFAPDVPEEFQRILRKCLEKERAQRYQSSRDLAIDLENLRRQYDTAQARSRSDDDSATLKRPEEVSSTTGDTAFPWRAGVAVAAAAVVALLAAGVVYFKFFRAVPVSSAVAIRSLVVLPLENLSGDAGQEYFADGLTEALTTELSKIGELRVISRTSAMQYKGARKSLPEIARELNVHGVVRGSVIRTNDRVKVTVQLIRAGTDQNMWAESYLHDLTDILILQNRVARDISKEVQVQLTAQDTARFTSTGKVNPEAYDAYLRGRFYWSKGAREDLEKAKEYFELALAKDPRYAPAYAGLADYYSVLPFYGDAHPDEVFPKAKQAVAKALELDNSLAEAHGTQAYILTYYDWDWTAAQREFDQALALSPNDATLRHRYSRYLSSVGRIDEALAELERARLLDPSSLVIKANVGVIYYFARQYDRAIEELQKVLNAHPDFGTAQWGLALAHEQKGNYDQALAQLEKAASRRRANALASLGHLYGLIGRKEKAKEILEDLSARTGKDRVSPYQLALVHVGLGDKEAAMEALQRAYRERATLLSYLKMDPRLDPLRADPQFQDLMAKMNYPK